MIVVDTNILIYSLILCEKTALAQNLRAHDADWRVPDLCQHETLNVLVNYQRSGLLTLDQCQELLRRARAFMQVAQSELDLSQALHVAAQLRLTGYDAQYLVLAQTLDVPLITEDRKLRNAAPGLALSMNEFLAR